MKKITLAAFFFAGITHTCACGDEIDLGRAPNRITQNGTKVYELTAEEANQHREFFRVKRANNAQIQSQPLPTQPTEDNSQGMDR